MHEWVTNNGMAVTLFVCLAVVFTFSLGRLLPTLDERSRLITWLTFRFMGLSRWTYPEARSSLLSLAYFGWCILGMCFFAGAYGLDVASMLRMKLKWVPLIAMGIMGEISLSNLLVSAYLNFNKSSRPYILAEIANIPWIAGIRMLPSPFIIAVPALSAFLEEFFYRGILLLILLAKLGVQPWTAITLVTIFFTMSQVLQLRTVPQIVVICCASLSISFVGGILMIYTGSVIPAALCHASFVVFFMEYAGIKRRGGIENRSGID